MLWGSRKSGSTTSRCTKSSFCNSPCASAGMGGAGRGWAAPTAGAGCAIGEPLAPEVRQDVAHAGVPLPACATSCRTSVATCEPGSPRCSTCGRGDGFEPETSSEFERLAGVGSETGLLSLVGIARCCRRQRTRAAPANTTAAVPATITAVFFQLRRMVKYTCVLPPAFRAVARTLSNNPRDC